MDTAAAVEMQAAKRKLFKPKVRLSE